MTLTPAEALGRAIAVRRATLNMPRATLCQRAQVSVPFMSEVERGRKEPSLSTLRTIATVLGLTPSALFQLADNLVVELSQYQGEDIP